MSDEYITMSEVSQNKQIDFLTIQPSIFDGSRSTENYENDKRVLQLLLQKALEVELFTIPLYMSSMYSICGYHQINTGNNFYQGRQWPGLAPKFKQDIESDSKQNAFNKVFKVFIEEMLHLQIAANLCNVYDQTPNFTNNSLVSEDFAWKCYGNENTKIPGIIDFKHLKKESAYKDVKVKLDSLNKEQIKLFIAIESSEHNLQQELREECLEKNYKISVPFSTEDEGKIKKGELLFGSISGLYTAILLYLLIEYKGDEKLFKKAFSEKEKIIQREHFNKTKDSNRASEYPNFCTNLIGVSKGTVKFSNILTMINGILDQGEGLPLEDLIVLIISKIQDQHETIQFLLKELKDVSKEKIEKIQEKIDSGEYLKQGINQEILDKINSILPITLMAVSPENLVIDEALENNHPSYDDQGNKINSASKAARGGKNGEKEHLEIFKEVKALISNKDFQTWDQYHANNNTWSAKDLITNCEDYQINLKNYPQLATAEEIAEAMNQVTQNKTDQTWIELLSQANTGTLKGLLNGMQKYWATEDGEFPGPAMGGSGDRMSICWALLGRSPNLSIAPLVKDKAYIQDYHACQGLYLPPMKESDLQLDKSWVKNGELGCASPAVYHSCKGSNTCKSEGGCGFVQSFQGGSSCGSSLTKINSVQAKGGCGLPDLSEFKSVPGANSCHTTGGCAVPISALQMFPNPRNGTNEGKMIYKNEDGSITDLSYKEGELVYDIAWKVYTQRYKQKFGSIPKKPKANILRLIFPPST